MKKIIGSALILLLMGTTPAMAQVRSGIGVHAGESAGPGSFDGGGRLLAAGEQHKE